MPSRAATLVLAHIGVILLFMFVPSGKLCAAGWAQGLHRQVIAEIRIGRHTREAGRDILVRTASSLTRLPRRTSVLFMTS